MTLQQLQYFRVTAKILHYTRASQALHITQPSLSHSLAELERELGVQLFVKKGKKVFLSPYGEAFLPYVEELFGTLDTGVRKLEAMSGQARASVNLGYVHSVSFTLVPSLIEMFYKDLGGSTISFYLQQDKHVRLMEALREGAIDMAITIMRPADMPCEVLMEQKLFLVVPREHPFATRDAVPFRELGGMPFITLAGDGGLQRTMRGYFSDHGVEQNIVMEAQDCDAIVNYIALGIGVSVIPLVPAVTQLGVKIVRLSDCACRRDVYLCWHRDHRQSDAVRRARNYFLQQREQLQ